jgi:decaprenylphospho-beta-D-ribofuranose 2-oxidase
MTAPMPLSGWGRYPVVDCRQTRPIDPDEATSTSEAANGRLIARGNGRSYGDASLNPDNTLVTRALDRFITFDANAGWLTCEAGVLLSDIIDAMLPRGWFPMVTPGTRFVTVGGMIASDVHGKNHHRDGSFCHHVAWFDLALGDGGVLRCSRDDHADLFAATCGGMGLTGVVLRACIRLRAVESAAIRQRTLRADHLDHAIELFETTLDWTYSVAWIDCLATGARTGRSVLLLGEHATRDELDAKRRAVPLARPQSRARRLPITPPAFVMGRTAMRLFNTAYYAAQRQGERLVDINPYFYPLDAVLDWNRVYGAAGFVQYQCVLPLADSRRGLGRLLAAIAATGDASFLAVLKRMGPASPGLIGFPMEGYTLALDFPASPVNLTLLDRLDAITTDHNGRVYLAKDARMAPAMMQSHPGLPAFREVRRRYGLDTRFSSLLSQRLGL